MLSTAQQIGKILVPHVELLSCTPTTSANTVCSGCTHSMHVFCVFNSCAVSTAASCGKAQLLYNTLRYVTLSPGVHPFWSQRVADGVFQSSSTAAMRERSQSIHYATASLGFCYTCMHQCFFVHQRLPEVLHCRQFKSDWEAQQAAAQA